MRNRTVSRPLMSRPERVYSGIVSVERQCLSNGRIGETLIELVRVILNQMVL